jgi:hypothetical protein
MDIYWNIFTMHGTMNLKFPNNTSKWQIEFNSAFKGLISQHFLCVHPTCECNFPFQIVNQFTNFRITWNKKYAPKEEKFMF